MRTVFSISLLISLVLASAAPSTATGIPARPMIEVNVDGHTVEGVPLAWSNDLVYLLGRDGRLIKFAPSKATGYRKATSRFRPYSVSELRAELLRELGHDYEVSGTSHYMVAHPRGQRDKWAQRFEDLYNSFVRYFSVRGFKLQTPSFPLIGIVCRNRADFDRYAAAHGVPVSGGIQGFYDLESNRIIVYDMQSPNSDMDWRRNASTIVHEATHQVAFNTGIHSRFSPPPLWVIEGLATLFEAPGMSDSRSTTPRSERVNRQRLRDYKAMISDKHDGRLPAEMTASDRFFRVSPLAAYAEAWALVFYLVETQPRQFAQYLVKTANREPFSEYSPDQRIHDFTSVFGHDWRQFDAQFGRFMNTVR